MPLLLEGRCGGLLKKKSRALAVMQGTSLHGELVAPDSEMHFGEDVWHVRGKQHKQNQAKVHPTLTYCDMDSSIDELGFKFSDSGKKFVCAWSRMITYLSADIRQGAACLFH